MLLIIHFVLSRCSNARRFWQHVTLALVFRCWIFWQRDVTKLFKTCTAWKKC